MFSEQSFTLMPSRIYAQMKSFWLALIIICHASLQTSALTDGEIKALSSILQSWPILSTQPNPWKFNNLSSACTPPEFYGVTCSGGNNSHVTGISISSIFLGASIPTALGELPYLETISLTKNNFLEGTHINTAAFKSPNLRTIILTENDLTGTIPPSIMDNPNLVKLDIEDSLIFGQLPEGIANLTVLRLGGAFTGTIPLSYSKLQRLIELSIVGDLDQTFPEWIDQLSNLRKLTLSSSKLTGPLPPGLFRLPLLQSLSITYSPLDTVLHPGIGNLTSLEYLTVFGSSIYGTIPSSIGRLTRLKGLNLSFTSLTGPFPPEFMQLKSLEHLYMMDMKIGFGHLPDDIGRLSRLVEIDFSNSGVTGTIPSSIFDIKHLRRFAMPGNEIEGTIPIFAGQSPHREFTLNLEHNLLTGGLENLAKLPSSYLNTKEIKLGFNSLTGEIPPEIFEINPKANPSYVVLEIYLQNNQLNGTIPDLALWSIFQLDLSNNQLSGKIPSKRQKLSWSCCLEINLSHNNLTGTIPPELYAMTGLRSLQFSYNQLEGNLEGWQYPTYDQPPDTIPSLIDFSYNALSGQLPKLDNIVVTELILSHNAFNGTFPTFSTCIVKLDLSHNEFSDTIQGNNPFNVTFPGLLLRTLHLSYNNIYGQLGVNILTAPISFLYLSHNKLTGAIPLPANQNSALAVLDLSYNQLDSADNAAGYQQLTSLWLNNNNFKGGLSMYMPQLTILDISNNHFSFSVSLLSNYPSLISISAFNNSIWDSLEDFRLENLDFADLSDNKLGSGIPRSKSFGLSTISKMFHHRLRQLNIAKNPTLIAPHIDTISPSDNEPMRTTRSSPSEVFPSFVTCYTLTFVSGSNNLEFIFDEGLFNYSQCDCAIGYYGVPPDRCFKCPESIAQCSGRTLTINANNFFIYGDPNSILEDYNSSDSSLTKKPHDSVLKIENCLIATARSQSNCNRISITIDIDDTPASILDRISTWNERQCSEGSEGRLCSKCSCEHPYGIYDLLRLEMDHRQESNLTGPQPKCYFTRGNTCRRCSKIFKPSQSIPIIIGVVSVSLIIVTIIMYFILKSKRKGRDKKWQNLSTLSRIWYRITEATNFGLISIGVLFIQILVELTHWDDYIFKAWAKLFNGDSESIGIVCLLPTVLNNPINRLLLRLVLPVAVTALVATSIGIAVILSRITNFYQNRTNSNVSRNFRSTSDAMHLLGESQFDYGSKKVDYPASALLLSATISVVQFFYFGIALASTEYFFYTVQASTNLKFVQNHPWMLYSDAEPLRRLSVPWIVIIVAGLPIAFIICAWKFRHQLLSPTTSAYMGSIFTKYKTKWYWWEIINVIKKLAIALLLRGIPYSNSLQSSFIILSIGFPLLLQTTLRPWKRREENVMDPIGGILLISSLFASNAQSFAGHNVTLYITLAIDLVYLIALVVLILYETITRKTDYEIIWEARFGVLSPRTDLSLNGGSSKVPHTPLMRSPIELAEEPELLLDGDEFTDQALP